MNKDVFKRIAESKVAVTLILIVFLVLLFVGTFFLTTAVIRHRNSIDNDTTKPSSDFFADTTTKAETTTAADSTIITTTTMPTETTTKKTTTTTAPSEYVHVAAHIEYPNNTAEWELICLNRSRRVSASVEKTISLSNVAGTQSKMDSRAADAYNKMYDAAAEDNIYLTPCSGYRSYSRQKYLFDEYINEYLSQGYNRAEAENLASKRRNPPGSSEHNIGICMDIICAASSANFQNTKEYAWLMENAADYGFILRYPEDKVNITGVKFEPWHWRYVGAENAAKIKASGLCLEEYLGLA